MLGGSTFHLSHVVDVFEGKVKGGRTVGFIIRIMPDREIGVFQRFFNRYPFRGIECQKSFKKIEGYDVNANTKGENLGDWLAGRCD
jgi:hypothetical protein